MYMKRFLMRHLFCAPTEGDGGGDGGGGAVDRGDDWTPTEDDDEAARATAKQDAIVAKAQKLEKETKQTAAVAKGGLKALETDGDPDGDGDPDETDEEKAEREAAAKKTDKRIPLKRHEAILAKERERREALETQVKNFQGAQTVVKTNEEISSRETKIGELEAELAKAQTDGEHAKVAKLMGDIRKLDREIVQLDAQVKIAAAEARAVETARYSITLERIEAAYPELNEDHEEFDQEVYDDVVDLMNAYKKAGRTPSDALQRAVKMKFGAVTAKQKAATTVTPKVDDEDLQKKTKADRAAAATDKTLKALKQPATATAKTGINSNDAGAARTARDVIKMSQKDFAALDEKELARLRGDEVEAE